MKQDGICIGGNIRRIREKRGIKQTELVILVQLENVILTREALVKIESGKQHIRASQLKAIKKILKTTYDELME